MRQMTVDLDEKQQRPVVILDNGLAALLDTGAYFPVWTDEEDILTSSLNGKLIREHMPITGFGGTAYGNVYQATFRIGELIFPEMHIIANSDLDTSYNLILSATMFQQLIYEIDDAHHRLNITIPDDQSNVRNLKIEDRNGKIHVLCHSRKE
ncbi:MAG: hypothetical protein IJ733_07205 [Lachnospiraceae bacterium]|nr:hypothetical protein [Lachnospiraceae bacterium]